MKHKLLITLLCVAGIALSNPLSAEVIASGTCGAEGDNLTWVLTSDSVLTISGTGAMVDYVNGSVPWSSYQSFITSVVIGNSITNIGNYAFFNCQKLRSVALSVGVTRIGNHAFSRCSNLSNISIPNSVTHIEAHAFSYCSKLTSFIIPEGVISIGEWAFFECTGITTIEIPGSVLSIGGRSFRGCSGLKSVTIPSSVTSIGSSAFIGCEGLTAVHISDVASWCNITFQDQLSNPLVYAHHLYVNNTEIEQLIIPNGITNICNYAFCGCSGLVSVTIPNSVTSIGSDAFSGCNGLTSIDIPEGVTNIGNGAFNGCFGLTSITIPNSVTTIGSSAFAGCRSLTSVIIPNGVTSIYGDTFYGCSGLTSVTIPNSVTSIGSDAFSGCNGLTITIPNTVTSIGENAFYEVLNLEYSGEATGSPWGAKYFNCFVEGLFVYDNADKTTLIECPKTATGDISIPNGVINIGDRAFYKCNNISSCIIPNSVKSIGNYAFYGCRNLVSIILPNGLISIGPRAFCACRSLSSITIPNSVTTIGTNAFFDCSNLISIVVEAGNSFYDSRNDCNAIIETATNTLIVGCKNTIIPNDITNIGNGAFDDCFGLTSVTIPNSVTTIGSSAFAGCTGLTSAIIPEGVTSIANSTFINCDNLSSITIPNSVTNIGNNAFYGCRNLTSIDIPNGVTSIGEWAFSGCAKLTAITIPSNVTTFGSYAFHDCSGLTSVVISQGVHTIGEAAFSGCANLTSVTIPNSVTSIGDHAFSVCINLGTITIPNNVESIGGGAFYEVRNVIYTGDATGSPWGAKNVNGYVDGYLIFNDETKTTLLACSPAAIGHIEIPSGVITINDGAFLNCGGITSITIPSSVTEIGDNAFSFVELSNNKLESIVVEDGNTVYDSRNDCNAIIKTASNTLILGCQNTIIPNSVTRIEQYAFAGCTSLFAFVPSSVTSIGGMAFHNVPNVVYTGPSVGLKPWGARSVNGLVDGELVYNDETRTALLACSSAAIGAITIPNTVTSIGNRAFDRCKNVNSIQIPEGVTAIGVYAFRECSGLASITIPSNVTTFGRYAFQDCSGLTSVVISEGVDTIGEGAFHGCENITSILCYANNPPVLVSYPFNDIKGTVTVYVPAQSIKQYASAEDWRDFIDIRAIPPTIITLADDEIYGLSQDSTFDAATYQKSLDNDRIGKYQSWLLPFDYTLTDEDLDKFYFYRIHMIADSPEPGEDDDTGELWVYLKRLHSGFTLQANMPYVYKPKEAVIDYEFTTLNTTLKARQTGILASTQTMDDIFSFYATYDFTSPSALDPFYYVNIDGGLSLGNESSVVVSPYRWILRVTSKNGATLAPARSMRFVGEEDEVTNINSIQAVEDGIWYSVDGRRLGTTRPAARGIYVRNGKKEIIY